MKKILSILILISFLTSKESIKITRSVDKNNSNIVSATATLYLDQNIDSIFTKITDFPNYHKNIPVVDNSEVYYQNSDVIKLKMTANILYMFDAINHFSHKVDTNNHKITWTLDESKDNTLEYAKGGWTLEKLSMNMTKVTYKNSIKTPSFLPLMVSNYIIGKGVEDSTLWLMKEH